MNATLLWISGSLRGRGEAEWAAASDWVESTTRVKVRGQTPRFLRRLALAAPLAVHGMTLHGPQQLLGQA